MFMVLEDPYAYKIAQNIIKSNLSQDENSVLARDTKDIRPWPTSSFLRYLKSSKAVCI